MNITFTEAAASKVLKLLESDIADEYSRALRVFVKGGGCTGFQYGFAFEAEPAEDDYVIEAHGATVYIDPVSAVYLDGATVDYLKELIGEQFSISNPNVTSQCGCGSSFSI